jgi:hypothetical protein
VITLHSQRVEVIKRSSLYTIGVGGQLEAITLPSQIGEVIKRSSLFTIGVGEAI